MTETHERPTGLAGLAERLHARSLSRRGFLRYTALAAGVAGAGALLAACGGDDDDDSDKGGATPVATTGAAVPTNTQVSQATAAPNQGGTPKKGGTFTYALNQEPESLDPEVTTYAVTNKININIFDGLVWQAPDLSYVPGLAEKWEVSPDGMAFTFTLRQDVKFHDGTPLNADAVKFSWDRIVNPDTQSKTALNQMGPFSQATVIDEHTIKAEFKTPFAPFLDAVSQSYCSPVSPAGVQKANGDFAHNLVGTGPFKLKEWVDKDHITLVRNDDYNWAPSIFNHQGPAYLDQIVFKIIVDDVTRVGTLQSGETDGIDSVPPKDVATFKNDSGYQIVSGEAPGIPSLLTLNTEKFPTDDIAVRQALNYATDKDTIIDTLFFGLYTAAYSPMSSVTLGYDDSLKSMYPFDTAKAKQTMEAAGWTLNGDYYEKDGKQASIVFFTFTGDTTPPLLQAQWKDAGINTEIKQMDYNALIPQVTKGDHNAASIGWIQGDPDTVGIILYIKNIDSGYAWTRFRNQELDDTLVQAASTVNADERKQLYTKVQKIVMDNALVLPINNLFTIYGLRDYVKNFRVDTRGWYPWLYDVYLDK